uniref:FAD/NAD(P)-binding domain-containing protein n=1 Tax=Mola mola TaxID=94237 RepID=A0A3Q3X0W2_MOLML
LDVLIIGAGPHALTLASLLSNPLSLRVVDSYGEWTALWESQFTALNIPHLRSHTLVHTDPLNKKALQEFVLRQNRSAELHTLPDQVYILDENAFFNDMRLGRKERKRLNITTTLKKSLSFSLPGTKLSVDFFKDQVVVATGPTRAQMANIPSWVKGIGESYPEERLQHTVHLMVCEAGQRVMVVGGGLTSAHVVSIALQQGASHVTWVMRKHLQLKQFDVGDVESLVGRYSHVEHGIKMDGQAYLRQFYNERSLHKRLAMIRRARKGGAVTPEAYVHLRPFIQSGQVDVKTYCEVTEISWCYRSQAWSLSLSTGHHWTGDKIWLATGCKLDVRQDPLLSEVMKEFPIQAIDGWPCISESLQWAEECPLYLMGQYTALQVGPHAINLAGAQAAGMRIAKDIIYRQQQDGTEVSELSGEKPKTEEYIQQMRGLLWL